MNRMILRAVGAVIAAAAMGTAADAGNFEFVIPGEPGLSLTVTGYRADGGTMFEAQTGHPESRDSKTVFVVRIDETVVRSAPLSRWCVSDETQRWSALKGHDGATTICDDRPSETRGSYAFKPLSAVARDPEPAAAPSEMSTADAAACVQKGLNQLGFDAGPVDGQMGRRTFAAALAFAGAQDGELYPELSNATALVWCTRLERSIAAGTARGPLDDLAKFRFGPDIDVATARDTQAGVAAVDAYFRKVFGSALEKPGTIYVSSDPDWLADSYVAHLKAGSGIRRGKFEWFSGCHGGEAGYGFMFFCAKSDVFSSDWFGSGRAAQRAFAIAHEYFHMLQYERAVGSLDGCCDGQNTLAMLGPQWLVEGAAEYMAFRLLGDSGRMNFRREIDWHTQKAAEVGSSLEQMQTRQGYYAEQRASSAGMIAAHLLAERAGLASLARFYDEMGKDQGWEAAFEAAFGLTPAAFSDIYEDAIR